MIQNNRQGFTLLEVLVATAIMSILAVTVLGAFTATLEAGEGVEERTETVQTARFIIRKITEDLKAVSLLPNNKNGMFVGTDSGDSKRATDRLAFTSFNRNRLFAGRGADQAVIEWYVKKPDDRDANYVLMRSENPFITDLESTTDKVEAWDVTSSLRSFTVRYLDKGAYVDSFDSKLSGQLPSAVEITFELIDSLDRTITKTAFITLGERA